MVKSLGLLVVLCVLFTSCNINRDIMFKTPLDYKFDQVSDSLPKAFRIQANDQITFRLFANDGFRMIDLVDDNGTGQRNLQRAAFNYQVDFDGQAKLPLLGLVRLAGLTIREAEMMLEKSFTVYYNRPFVQLQVNTRRVVVFPGGGGDARVIPLENSNTTLLEAIAAAGGLSRRADSRKVKVFRNDSTGVRKVYQFDMSDINGLKNADMVMLADDIVYVQPNPEIARELINDINPFITLLTTTVLVIGIVRGFSQ
ncbi:MAG: polysaccharide biosynthesis/export family protein [Flavobacteriales bacterium]|nr:polysaccharide biosynthesis/export family protein [Flavobacteriales bacterium]MBL0046371.1 polysaccharide biosynthesis/export family protein [Flavobacteriales bacterium]